MSQRREHKGNLENIHRNDRENLTDMIFWNVPRAIYNFRYLYQKKKKTVENLMNECITQEPSKRKTK